MPTKVRIVKAMVFPAVMYGCESWTINSKWVVLMIRGLFSVGNHLLPSVSSLLSSSNGGKRGLLFWDALCKSSKSSLKFISHLITVVRETRSYRKIPDTRLGEVSSALQ